MNYEKQKSHLVSLLDDKRRHHLLLLILTYQINGVLDNLQHSNLTSAREQSIFGFGAHISQKQEALMNTSRVVCARTYAKTYVSTLDSHVPSVLF